MTGLAVAFLPVQDVMYMSSFFAAVSQGRNVIAGRFPRLGSALVPLALTARAVCGFKVQGSGLGWSHASRKSVV